MIKIKNFSDLSYEHTVGRMAGFMNEHNITKVDVIFIETRGNVNTGFTCTLMWDDGVLNNGE